MCQHPGKIRLELERIVQSLTKTGEDVTGIFEQNFVLFRFVETSGIVVVSGSGADAISSTINRIIIMNINNSVYLAALPPSSVLNSTTAEGPRPT